MIHVPSSTIGCINRLLEQVPELRPVYDEHIHDNGELLPHVLLGDVTRYVVQHMRSGEVEASRTVGRILDCLEHCMVSGDEQVKELVSVSFVENLLGHDDVLASLRRLVGPSLAKEIETYGK